MKIESCSKGRCRIGSCFRRSVHHQEALKFDDELHVFLAGMPFFQIEGKISLGYFKQNEITNISIFTVSQVPGCSCYCYFLESYLAIGTFIRRK